MWLLLPLGALAGFAVVFGLLVWFAAGIARVEEYRSEDDRRMIAHLAKHHPPDTNN